MMNDDVSKFAKLTPDPLDVGKLEESVKLNKVELGPFIVKLIILMLSL